jgi:hypothetical protein
VWAILANVVMAVGALSTVASLVRVFGILAA